MGANGITWAKPIPLGDYLLGGYFEIKSLKFSQKYWKFSSHYYVNMVYIKYLLKICHFQKHSIPFTSDFIV
jgi:hypothetical protein